MKMVLQYVMCTARLYWQQKEQVVVIPVRATEQISCLNRRRKSLDKSKWSDPSSHANHRFLGTPVMARRLRLLHGKHRATKKCLFRSSDKLKEVLEQQSLAINESANKDLTTVMTEEEEQVSRTDHVKTKLTVL